MHADPIDWPRLAQYWAGESTAEEAAAVARWLEASEERRALATELRTVWEATGGTTDAREVEAAWRDLAPRIRGAPVSPVAARSEVVHRPLARLHRWPRGVGRGNAWRVTAVVASLVVAIGLGVAAERHGAAESGRTYATAAGQRLSVTLVDGTQLTLAPASRVRLGADYGREAGVRSVELEGEAYFAVVHDEAHPFTVRAHGVVARDVGTAFDVRAYPDGAGARVAVAEGAVAVAVAERCATARNGAIDSRAISPVALPQLLATHGNASVRALPPASPKARSNDRRAGAEPISVSETSAVAERRPRPAPRNGDATSASAGTPAGEGTGLTPSNRCGVEAKAGDVATVQVTGVAVEHGADVASMTRWTSGELVFDRAPMRQVVAELSRWYAVRVAVEDGSLGDTPMTITVNGQPVEEVLRALATASRARVEMRDGWYVLFTSDHAFGGGER